INFISIISPFLWAFAIAYLLNPLMTNLERRVNIPRGFSILIIYFFVIGLIAFAITIMSPKIVRNIGQLLKDMPEYFDAIEEWARNLIVSFSIFDKYGATPYLEQYLDGFIEQISWYINLILSTIVSKLINYTSAFIKI